MTIRDELKLLGPEAVRAGMIAFEHRGDKSYTSAKSCREGGFGIHPCCFLSHAMITSRSAKAMYYSNPSAVEVNFENWTSWDAYSEGREGLRQECIAFLAEHGDAPENRPASLRAPSRETAGVGECRFGRGE